MNKPDVSKMFTDIRKGISKHSPEILTGLGIAGMITTTVLAVKATPKALEKIQDAEIEKVDKQVKEGKEPDELVKKLTAFETVKAAWKPYIPAAITGVVSVGCLVGASSVNARRNAALATAYQLSSTALSEYKEKVIETIGEKKEKTVRDKIAQDKVDKNPVEPSNVIVTGSGKSLCYDPQFGQYFESTIDDIKKAVTELNYRMIDLGEEYVSLNDFYDELGVERIEVGEDLGWNIGRDGKVMVATSAAIAKNGTPCIVIHYEVAPKYNYFKLT